MLVLPDRVPEYILPKRLKLRMSARLRVQAQYIIESFDEVVARLRRVSTVHMGREMIREIQKGSHT